MLRATQTFATRDFVNEILSFVCVYARQNLRVFSKIPGTKYDAKKKKKLIKLTKFFVFAHFFPSHLRQTLDSNDNNFSKLAIF